MINLNTNLSSLIAQQSLSESTNKLNQAIERMSTGFKINHASDNAANYSISTNMTTKIGAYQVAEENAAMGLDLLATAEGSLSQISEKLGRLRALAVQAENGTYGDKSLKAINAEANALIDEIARITNTTEYNGKKLFNKTSQFIEDIDKRDTSSMTSLASVSPTTSISSGMYSISTAEELAQLAIMTDNGLIQGGEFVLANDIDLKEYCAQNGWNSIGSNAVAFKATFDGNGHVIRNLSTEKNSDSVDANGLFYNVVGCVKNLGLEDVCVINSLSSYNVVGGLAGKFDGDLANCYITGTVSNNAGDLDKRVGGLVALGHSSNIESCYADVNVYGNLGVGGIVGTHFGSIKNCHASGNIYSKLGSAGGIVGLSHNNAIDSVIIENSYSECNVYSDGKYTGGLVGSFSIKNATFKNCYATGRVEGTEYVGGLVGSSVNHEEIHYTNCYSASFVKGIATVGGLLGTLQVTTTALFKNCYSDPTIDCPVGSNAIFVGGLYNATPIYEDCYYDLERSDNINGWGIVPTGNFLNYDFSRNPFSLAENYINLQVGINGNDTSQIAVQTSVDLKNIFNLRTIGLDKEKDFLSKIDKLVESVSSKQTEIGSASNRLYSVLDEIEIQYENLVSSRSTIRDADISEVSASYIQQQILQQASATLLATANQSPSIALQLI